MSRPSLHIRSSKMVILMLLSLVLSTVACQLDIGGPEPPGPPIPTEASASEDLIRTWQQALSSAVNQGQIMVILNETQLTSFLASKLDTEESAVLTEPQVYLREDLVQVYGTTERGPLRANILLSITPEITPDGEVEFALTGAEIGPIPAPDALRETISALLTEAFTGTFGSLATGIRVTSIAVGNGEMAIVGELR